MRVGFDIDGVLCKIDVGLLRIIDNMPSEIKKSAEEWYYRERRPDLNPLLFLSKEDLPFYIITSRPERLSYITLPWVNRYYPNAKLYVIDHQTVKGNGKKCISRWLKEMAEKKAKVINDLELDVYFEDSPEPVSWLRKFCPNTKIIQYGGRW